MLVQLLEQLLSFCQSLLRTCRRESNLTISRLQKIGQNFGICVRKLGKILLCDC